MSDNMQKPNGSGTLNDPEPAPVRNDLPEIWPLIMREFQDHSAKVGQVERIVINAVINDARERHDQGMKKYGVGLQPFNGRDALKDAYQEALDMLAYTRQFSLEACTELEMTQAREMMSIAANSVMAYRAVIYARDGK